MKAHPLLDSLAGPQQIRHFSPAQLAQLAEDTRDFLIRSISETGGHFSSNLGTVELTVGLLHHFDFLADRIVWDVGHQAYPYKILTDRRDRFHTLRQHGGISGFLKREESPYDHFGAGHASTSISAALGFAKARDLQGKDFTSIAVIGDGSMTAGQAFEGLNQAGYLETKKLLVILNDNDMSINPSVGSLQGYLNQMISGQYYQRWRARIEGAIKSIPFESVSRRLSKAAKWSEESFKRIAIPGLLFEDLGFSYLGPVDGHDVGAVCRALAEAKQHLAEGPVLLQVQTRKGHGYEPAERDPLAWHGVSPFDVETGAARKPAAASPRPEPPSYTSVFGKALLDLARQDEKIVAITAAMTDGTGLNAFQEAFPQRCFDVGIAEQHAVTFAAGLAAEGLHPVCAIYSTFLQRGFDQVLHDVCLQNLPVTFALDRAGIVGADGPPTTASTIWPTCAACPTCCSWRPRTRTSCGACCSRPCTATGPPPCATPAGRAWACPSKPPSSPFPSGRASCSARGRTWPSWPWAPSSPRPWPWRRNWRRRASPVPWPTPGGSSPWTGSWSWTWPGAAGAWWSSRRAARPGASVPPWPRPWRTRASPFPCSAVAWPTTWSSTGTPPCCWRRKAWAPRPWSRASAPSGAGWPRPETQVKKL